MRRAAIAISFVLAALVVCVGVPTSWAFAAAPTAHEVVDPSGPDEPEPEASPSGRQNDADPARPSRAVPQVLLVLAVGVTAAAARPLPAMVGPTVRSRLLRWTAGPTPAVAVAVPLSASSPVAQSTCPDRRTPPCRVPIECWNFERAPRPSDEYRGS